tara:strand:- start:194 stop:511 length:318 start_codon:yes stop_codon:yes gene_type:complete
MKKSLILFLLSISVVFANTDTLSSKDQESSHQTNWHQTAAGYYKSSKEATAQAAQKASDAIQEGYQKVVEVSKQTSVNIQGNYEKSKKWATDKWDEHTSDDTSES